MACDQLLFYQHNIQSFLLNHPDKYSGIIIPLSVATAFKEGTDGFVRALCKKVPDKIYMIDPRSPLFQQAWDRKNVRPAHSNMTAQLGKVFDSTLSQGRPLTLDDLTETVLADIASTSLTFQRGFGQHQNSKLKKYAKLAGVDSLGALSSPRRLIPPYFRFQGEDGWLKATLGVIDRTIEQLKKEGANNLLEEISPVLHPRDFNSGLDWKKLGEALTSRGIKACFLYPNNFKETEASAADLASYRTAAQHLVASGLDTYSLHGGFFAAALSLHGLKGFGSGIGYGEWRDSGYHKGGVPLVRIYVPKLHRYLQGNEVQDLLDRFGRYFAEDSDLLTGILEAGGSALAITVEQANEHFLACRAQERAFLAAASLETVRSSLIDVANDAKAMATKDDKNPIATLLGHATTLEKWAQSL